MTFAGIINSITLAAMVGVGFYQINEVQAKQAVKNIPAEEIHCLQQNVFFEARNQSTLGQVAVAWVTLNRMESSRYPDTICEVVWQKKQFSWTGDGKTDTPSNNIVEWQAWEDAGIVADAVLLDWVRAKQSPISDAVMFHADYVEPYWVSSYSRVTQIDDHIFYE